VRPMRPADAAAVTRMARELAASVGDPEVTVLESELIRDGSGPDRWFDCLVAELGSELAGYAVLCKGFEAHTGKKRLWLGDLYVQPSARLRGVGRALMTAVARHALRLGCEAVYWELNATGAAFYRTLSAEHAADHAVMRIDRTRLETIAAGAETE
jgi:GNAT superfamily N-acetyltransferase